MEKGYFRNGVSLFVESIQKKKKDRRKNSKSSNSYFGKIVVY